MKLNAWVWMSVGLFTTVVNAANPPTGRYKTVIDNLTQLQARYAEFSEIVSIGTNDDNVEIYALRVSTTPKVVSPEKIGQLVVSTHHGNESGAPQFTMHFIEQLLARYASESVWRENLGDMEWTIIPVLNISGYNANQRHEKGQDPNRDYANPCTSNPGGKLKSVRNLMALLQSRVFTGSVTVHGYDGSLTYPWGVHTDNDHTADHNLYHQIFTKAATFNDYRVGTAAEIVYPANGCFEDYVYWKHGAWSLLLELESGSASDIKATSLAISSFFDQLNATPSNQHDFTATCTAARGPERWE